MRRIFLLLTLFVGLNSVLLSQSDTLVVEAACGQCQFGVAEPKGCDLAVKIGGTVYFVDGTNIDDHGDAHDHEGLCNAIRKAKVTGKIIDKRFVAKSFSMLAIKNTAVLTKPKN